MINKVLSFLKKDTVEKVDKNFITMARNQGFGFIGSNINDCGDIVFTKNTFYEVQEYCTEACAYMDKITNWIGKNGIDIIDSQGKTIKNEKLKNDILNTFSVNTFKLFKEQYFTHHFCSGDIYLYPQKNFLGEITAQVVDSRTMTKKINKVGQIIGFEQYTKTKTIYTKDEIYNSIVRYNSNNPFYGKSKYESIVYDAMSEKETSRRNFYFFRNNATPNVIYILDPALTTKENLEKAQDMINERHRGSQNSFKPMVSNAIKDAKVLDISNKDLDLINMREFFIKKIGMVFQIDPRLIGFIQDVGAYNAIQAIKQEAKETLDALSKQMETDMNNFYKKFIDKKFQYTIKLKTESFEDTMKIQENQREDLKKGIVTLNEVRNARGREQYKQEWANQPMLESNLVINDNLTSNANVGTK